MSPASFSCDACGAAVGLHDRRCSSCGKVFDAVRCPRCGHQGAPGEFNDGCPKCRYLAGGSTPPVSPRKSRTPGLFGPTMGVLLALLALAVALAWVLRQG